MSEQADIIAGGVMAILFTFCALAAVIGGAVVWLFL